MVGLLATHPPLEERIRRLDPQWDGLPLFEDVDELDDLQDQQASSLSLVSGAVTRTPATGTASLAAHGNSGMSSVRGKAETDDNPLSAIGHTSEMLRQQVLATLPKVWHDLLRNANACEAVLLAIWASPGHRYGVDVVQVDASDQPGHGRILRELAQLDDPQRMLVFDYALEGLDALTASEFSRLERQVRQSVDGGIKGDVVRWAIGWQLRRRLQLVPASKPRARYGKLADIQPACEVLLSMLCHTGSEHEAMAQYVFQRCVAELQLTDPEFWSRDEISCERLESAVQLVAELAPRPRRALLIALGRGLAADQGITTSEAHFVRGLCAALALPTPAILPGQAVTPGL
jgi:hypothetical protein